MMTSDYETFSDLPEELQIDALREGEQLLAAQLSIATAADTRALAWGGLLVAAVTGSLGGGVALAVKEQPDYWLAFLSLGFAAFMALAAHLALGREPINRGLATAG